MRAWGVRAALVVVALLLSQQPGDAQSPAQMAGSSFTTDVALVTTSETTVIASDSIPAPAQTVTACVYGWAQLTTGTNTTAVTARIRRGSAATGTLVGEANAVTIGAAAGSTEQFQAMFCESRSSVASLEYNFTLQQTAASANGAALAGGILVLVK